MSNEVTATVVCETCGVWVKLTGGSGVNLTGAREIAAHDYGWTVGRDQERCFDHRTKPIEFHAYTPGPEARGFYDACSICGKPDSPRQQRLPQHRQVEIEANAAELRRKQFTEWARQR